MWIYGTQREVRVGDRVLIQPGRKMLEATVLRVSDGATHALVEYEAFFGTKKLWTSEVRAVLPRDT